MSSRLLKVTKTAAIAMIVGIAVGVATTLLLPGSVSFATQAIGALGVFGDAAALQATTFAGANAFAAGTIGLFFGISGALGVVANAVVSPSEPQNALPDTAKAVPAHDAGFIKAPATAHGPAAHAALAAAPAPFETPGATIRLPERAERIAMTPAAPHLH